MGATTQANKPLIGNERTEQPEETPERLTAMIAAYTRAKTNAEGDKARLADLMQRKKAQTWDAAKKAKMVRRFMTANKTIDEAAPMINHLQDRLSQITTAAA